MRIFDTFGKFRDYFGDNTYIGNGNKLKLYQDFANFTLPFYPINYSPLLDAHLFEKFDKNGIPLKYLNKNYTYFYTKIFTYGLASLHRHLMGIGDKPYCNQFFRVVDYIINTIYVSDDVAYFRNYEIASKVHSGRICGAMEQGLGISILCYAHALKPNNEYIELAEKCLQPYYLNLKEGGVSRRLDLYGIDHWYEEFPTRPIHVLNGNLDSLIGPYFLYKLTGSNRAKEVLYRGVKAVEKMLPHFDLGYWSNYFLADNGPAYIASMKYHSIHIFQLNALGEWLQHNTFLEYAQRFERYKQVPLNKYRALIKIAVHKAKRTHRQ